jgi:protein phosphatase
MSLLPGESLVICSDGITDYVAHGEATVAAIIGSVVRSLSAQDAATQLVEMANRGGGGDNATVIVARQIREKRERIQ